jgi:hypothetical protein
MRMRTIALAVLLLAATSLYAGGALEQVDITGNVPSPIAGQVVGRLTGIRWDARSIPIIYHVNAGSLTAAGLVPNPLGAAFVTLPQITAALQASFDPWNNLPTSFINMQIDAAHPINKTSLAGFDFVNELTFRTASSFTAIASSPSTSLISDSVFADGDDIDGDGDSDVSSAITVAQDVDGDGDIEFPAGFYRAGTILDNDVQFNTKTSNGFRFTVDPAQRDTNTRSVDIRTTATHEFGHSHGLSHSMDNQTSATDGDGATMFPFIDTGDPAAETAQASLSSDDKGWSSYFYPEGSATSGPAALQPGDVAFDKVYGFITGEIRHGVLNQPVAGASVSAYKWDTGDLAASGYSGTTRVSVDPATGGLFLFSVPFDIADGRYTIPVEKGSYSVGVEPVDGSPAAATNISLTCQIGSIFGQLNFNEEFYNNNSEGAVELRPGQRKSIPIQAGRTQAGINITTGRSFNINNFGNRNFVGFTGAPAGSYYAMRVPVSQIQALINALGGAAPLIQGIAADTAVANASVSPVFAEAMLTTGTINADGSVATVNLTTPLQKVTGFLAQDNDFAPLYFQEPQDLGRTIRDGIASGAIQNLFMVLRVQTTTPFPGVAGQAPFIGLDGTATSVANDVPLFGLSYFSSNGLTFNRDPRFNFRFSLIASEPLH